MQHASSSIPPLSLGEGLSNDPMVVEMACGDADPNFVDSQEDDWHGCRQSSCEEFSEEDEDDQYGDEDEDQPSIEEMTWPPEMSWSVQDLQQRQRNPRGNGRRRHRREPLHVGGAEGDNAPPIPAGLEFEPDLVFHEPAGMGVPLGGEGGPRSPVHVHGWDALGGREWVGGNEWGVGDGWGGREWVGGNGWGARDGWGRENDEDEPLPHAARREGSPLPQRVQRLGRPCGLPTLDISDTDSSEGDVEGGVEDINGVRHMYCFDTWAKEKFVFDPPPMEFTGVGGPRGTIFHRMPTFMMLFQLFWPDTLLQRICTETNRYATTIDGEGNLPGGTRWRRLLVAGLKAFIAISILIGLKRQPNKKTYWNRKGSFFHCPIISSIFSRDRFQAITKCLHLTNPNTYVTNREEVGYDKMGQVRWLVDAIRGACMREYSLGKYVTVDEMMIRYKGSYCPARQYMPNKPEKWGVKVWCLADSTTKFVYNFEIYCGKDPNIPNGQAPARNGEGNMASVER
jgi:hypothetical protein